MKTKNFLPWFVLVFLLASCKPEAVTTVPVTQNLTSTQPPMEIPTITPLPTANLGLPTLTPLPTAIPYPTASVVQANAVAFIERDSIYNFSLWVVNGDGSGEKKLSDITRLDSLETDLMKWSPNGEWISYRSEGDLWMVSRDGLLKRILLSFPDEDIGKLYTYVWSPDSSKIAYIQKATYGPVAQITVGMLDLMAEKAFEISSHQAPDPMPISWSPDGKYILFAKDFSYSLYEVATGKIAKEVKPNGMGCWVGWNAWSPNSKWFFDTQHGNGRYFRQWICVSGLDGSNREIYVEGTVSTPVWDKMGNLIYFVARKTNPDSDPNLKIDERLMRYDVRTQKTERLLSLREIQTYGYIGQVSISPNGSTLVIRTQDSENQISYILIDLKTFSLKKFTHETFCTWSADSENFICSQESNGYSAFHNLNIETGVTNIFSGEHTVEYWAISPVATSP